MLFRSFPSHDISGTKFNPGAKLVFPNQDKYLPNENVDLYRLDQNIQSDEVGTFVKNGTATVSSDGQIIETALDAIKEGSIYLVSNPRPTTTLRGQVRAEDGNVPVGQVQVTARGQQTYTDNSGSFVLKGIQTRQGERFSTRAVMVKADGQTMTGEIGNIEGVISGITSLPNPIILKSQTSNRSPVIIIQNKEIRIIPEKTEEIEFLCYDPDGENVKPYITPQLPWIELKDKSEGRWVIVVKAGLNLGSETYNLRFAYLPSRMRNRINLVNGKPSYGFSPAARAVRRDTFALGAVAKNAGSPTAG